MSNTIVNVDYRGIDGIIEKIVNFKISDISCITFDYASRCFKISVIIKNKMIHSATKTYDEVKKHFSAIDDFIYSDECIIANAKEFYSFNTLQDKNVVVIKYKHHPKNSYGEEKPILSLKPGKYYVAIKDRVNGKYKLLSLNKFDRQSSGYINVTIDHRIDEYSIYGWEFFKDEFIPIINHDKDRVNIKTGMLCRRVGIRFTMDELKDKTFIFNKLKVHFGDDSNILKTLYGEQYIKDAKYAKLFEEDEEDKPVSKSPLDLVQSFEKNIKFLDHPTNLGQRVHYLDIESTIPKTDWFKIYNEMELKCINEITAKRRQEKIIKNSLYGQSKPKILAPLTSSLVSFDILEPTPMGPPPEDMKYWWLKYDYYYDKHADLDENRFLLNHKIPYKKHNVDLSLGMDEEFLQLL